MCLEEGVHVQTFKLSLSHKDTLVSSASVVRFAEKNVHLYLEVYKKEMYLCYIQAIFKKLQISDLLGALTLSLKTTKVRNFFVQ